MLIACLSIAYARGGGGRALSLSWVCPGRAVVVPDGWLGEVPSTVRAVVGRIEGDPH